MSNIYITEPATKGKICLETTVGPIDIELWSRECPLACRNFVQLCMEGYYNGCTFHRLVKDFIVQTGDPTGTGHGGESIYGEMFKNEIHQRLKFSRRGLVGMAGEKKDQNNSQFFFTLGQTSELTGKHTLFGKVVGDTIFNLMKLNEYEVDKNERPVYLHKITGANILVNPFNDIKPRILKNEKKKERKREREEKEKMEIPAKKNTSLLSFGDEMEEDEQQIAKLNYKLKGKSAHDVLDDELLSKEMAVKPEELKNSKGGEEEIDEMEKEGRLDRIKNKFGKGNNKKKKFDDGEQEEEEDLNKLVDNQKEEEKQKEMEKISAELKQLQKEYKKSIKPKAEKEEKEESNSGGMKMYNKLKLKFKSETKGIVKSLDPKREDQTIALLERFQTKLERASVQGILTDKKIDMSDQKTQEEIILATSEDQGKIDFDAEDIQGEDWMNHELVAPEDTSGVTKARDANLREEDEDWYPIDDPRNKMNVRKRTQGGKMPDLFANAEPMALP